MDNVLIMDRLDELESKMENIISMNFNNYRIMPYADFNKSKNVVSLLNKTFYTNEGSNTIYSPTINILYEGKYNLLAINSNIVFSYEVWHLGATKPDHIYHSNEVAKTIHLSILNDKNRSYAYSDWVETSDRYNFYPSSNSPQIETGQEWIDVTSMMLMKENDLSRDFYLPANSKIKINVSSNLFELDDHSRAEFFGNGVCKKAGYAKITAPANTQICKITLKGGLAWVNITNKNEINDIPLAYDYSNGTNKIIWN